MTITTSLATTAQSLQPGDLVTLFDIDTSSAGGTDIFYLCPGTLANGTAPVWKGHTYVPFPIMADGFEWNGRGPLPKPKLTVSNVAGLLLPSVIQNNDLLGAKVTRWKTFVKYLDGQSNADPNSYFGPEIYYIDRKSAQTKTMMEFELASSLDQQGVMIPRRQFIRDTCSETYRRWDATHNIFVTGTCPYAGSNKFKVDDTPTANSAEDVCSKRLSGCIARFGTNAELPYSGWPGIAKTR
jgi:lambda family phage minor tail protein L